jgi:predicted phage terminase large subunit-like protein
MSQNEYEQLCDELEKRLCEEDLLEFTKKMHHDYKSNWFHESICKELEQFFYDVQDGKNPHLMIFSPPRHGKSELISRQFPAWAFGRDPNISIIGTSYASSLAERMCRDVQRVMDSDQYAKVFPLSSLNKKNVRTISGSALRNSEVFEILNNRGSYRAAGVGGGITGMGAELCMHEDTKVLTDNGYRSIKDLKVNDSVWSYNHDSRSPELKRVTNVFSRSVSDSFEIKISCGSKVVCTPEHPFWILGRGYTQAKDIRIGEVVIKARIFKNKNDALCNKMSGVRGIYRDKKSRLRKKTKEWIGKFLLFKKMLRRILLERSSEKGSQLYYLQKENNYKEKVLLKEMQGNDKNYKIKKLQNVRKKLQASDKSNNVLLNGLQKFSSLAKYAWDKKYKIQEWSWRQIQNNIYQNKAIDICSGQFGVRSLQVKKEDRGASHRWQQGKRHSKKFNNSLRKLPYNSPQITHQSVSRIIKNSSREIVVYDITVEENHNFFAEGVLVHNCIIDDPFKDHEEAYSPTIREKVYDWFLTTLYTRKMPNSGVIIVNTRWHEADLCGRLLADDPKKWKVVSYKAIAEEDEPHRKKGEALHPERYPIETLLEFKKTLGSRFFAAMYQQSPVPAEGSIINRTWFKYYKVLPRYDEMILSWDMSFKDSDSSDFVVGQCWARVGSLYYLVDQVRARMGFSATVEALKMMCKKYPKANAKLVEDKANGSAIIDHLKKEITGLIPIIPKESKLARLASVSPMFEAGNVFLPEAEEWCHDYTVELTTFPSGAHDDQVDSTSMALCYLRNNTNKFFGIMKR